MVSKQGFFSRIMSRLNLAEATPAVPAETAIKVIHAEPIGSSGTESYAGYPAEEYLQKMRGQERAEIFDQMRRSDYQVKLCLSAVKNPICSATWEVEPGDPNDDECKRDADLINHILFDDTNSDEDRSFKDTIREACTCVDFGHSVIEIVHKAELNHPEFGSYNGIASLGWRSPKTIERWNLDPKTGNLASITQVAHGDVYRYVDIPAQFLMVTSLEREGSNYEGISMLRPCYGSWMRKNTYLKLNAIGIEKHAIPTPTAKIPAGKEKTEATDQLEAVLKNYAQHQKNYLMYPEGYEVELNSNTYDPMKVEASIDAEDRRTAKAFMANFLELGMNSVGSFALSNDLSDFFLGGLEYVAGQICGGFNRRVIRQLILMNRGPRKKYPVLKCSGISDKAGKELAEVMNFLGGSKILTPDDVLEAHVRKRYGLPARDEATSRQTAAPAPFGAPQGDQGNPTETPQKQRNLQRPEAKEDEEDDVAERQDTKKPGSDLQSLSERIRLLSDARRYARKGF